jgi:hypothetical protein
MRLNSAAFWEMAMAEPSQNAHPWGAKLNPTIRISPM